MSEQLRKLIVIHQSTNAGTAHVPLGPQPSMDEWLERPRPSLWSRLFKTEKAEREIAA